LTLSGAQNRPDRARERVKVALWISRLGRLDSARVIGMRPIPSIAIEQCGVFSSKQAFAEDWTKDQLSYATRIGRIHRLRPGAYQIADLDSLTKFERRRWLHAGPAIAAVMMTPCTLASHSTAAVLRGMPLLFVPERPCASVVPWHTGEILRVHVHRCRSRPLPLPVGAVSCTTAELTAIDLAREHGVTSGVVALDFALHTGMTTLPKIYRDLDRCVRWPGVRAAREAIALADPLSESVLETRSRLKLREFGLPEPELQVSIGNQWGGFLARVDFYWDEFGVVGEADGDLKYDGTEPGPLIREKRRLNQLERLGLGAVRWGTPDMTNFAPVADELRQAFGRGAQRPRSDRRWTVLPRL
jgi:hypothetical protein